MKKLIYFILLIIMISCTEISYDFKNTQFIQGTVSYKENLLRYPYIYYLYVQNSKNTYKLIVNEKCYNSYEINDSCILLIKNYERVK